MVFGTRPEAIKLVPLLGLLGADPRFHLRRVVTGQHKELLRDVLAPFGVVPDVELALARATPSLNELVGRAVPLLDALFAEERPDMVVVQGDTTSAFAAALAAFHRRIPVAHVEAGLRSFDRLHPHPEEANRRMISALADLHLAPTAGAARHLLAEGAPPSAVFVTGNTVIDSLLLALATATPEPAESSTRPLVLITLHRRESWEAVEDPPLKRMLAALAQCAAARPDVDFLYPAHPNPLVRELARRHFAVHENARLCEPLPYLPFMRLMARAAAIVTDSGGIQEEAPTLGVPVLVLRETTERPEGERRHSIAGNHPAHGAQEPAGNHLIGTAPDAIREALLAQLARPISPRHPPHPNPFGDGHASERVRDLLLHFSGRGEAPSPFSPPDPL